MVPNQVVSPPQALSQLETIVSNLPRIHRLRPEDRPRIAESFLALVGAAEWQELREIAIALASALLPDGPGDAVYQALHAASPPIPSRADLAFLLRAADGLRLEAEPNINRRAIARATLAFLDQESPSPTLAASMRRWLEPNPDVWAATDLEPLIEIVRACDRGHLLREALIRLGAVVTCLAEKPAHRSSFLDQLAAIVDSRWAQQVTDGPTRTAPLQALAAFAELVHKSGESRWNVETIKDLSEGLPHDDTRPPGWLPPSFDPVARSWLVGRDDPSALRAYILDVLISTFDNQYRQPDRVALDRLTNWLARRPAGLEAFHIAARLRVTRLVDEFANDPVRLARELHVIALAGPARTVTLDLGALAESSSLRPRVSPLEPGWELASGWDEIAIAACTDPRPRWQSELRAGS